MPTTDTFDRYVSLDIAMSDIEGCLSPNLEDEIVTIGISYL